MQCFPSPYEEKNRHLILVRALLLLFFKPELIPKEIILKFAYYCSWPTSSRELSGQLKSGNKNNLVFIVCQ